MRVLDDPLYSPIQAAENEGFQPDETGHKDCFFSYLLLYYPLPCESEEKEHTETVK
jgi:hypothetical protein